MARQVRPDNLFKPKPLHGSASFRRWADVSRIPDVMDNYYDSATGEWVTDWTRYQAVLAQPRFAAIADKSVLSWPPRDAFDCVLELLEAVPDDTVHYVGSARSRTW